MDICEYVFRLIGSDLEALGAINFRALASGSKQVCLFTVAGRRVAVPYSPQDGVSGYVSEVGQTGDEGYGSWQNIYSFAGLPEAEDFDQLNQIIDQFPDNNDDVLKFIGTTLSERLG
jgi:hypothetical protein